MNTKQYSFSLLLVGNYWFKQSLFTFMKNMDNENHCMSIKQARLIVNAHKHNLLINSFCNNRYVLNNIKQHKKFKKSIKNRKLFLYVLRLNPFTAQGCQILKCTHTRLQTIYLIALQQKCTFNTVHVDRNPFTYSYKEEKSLNDFKFGTFIGRFPSDGAASIAVKELLVHDRACSMIIIQVSCFCNFSGGFELNIFPCRFDNPVLKNVGHCISNIIKRHSFLTFCFL